MVEKVKANPKIEIVVKRTVKELKGEGKLQKIVLQSTASEPDQELQVDGLFVAIGLKPNTSFIEGFIDLDESRYTIIYHFLSSVDNLSVCRLKKILPVIVYQHLQ